MKFFQLTRNERLGLVGAIFVFSFLLVIKYYDTRVEIQFVPAALEETVKSQPAFLEVDSVAKVVKSFDGSREPINVKAFEKFDPNKVDISYWGTIGFPDKISTRIFKFIHSGRGIKDPKDLELVYGMKNEWINSIKDSLVLNKVKIDLNVASADELQELKGVGEKLANRIVKFRDLLGGFHSIKQLSLVYGLDSNVVINNAEFLRLNQKHNKLPVLTLGLKQMSKHPYLDEQQAEEIIRLRSVNSQLDSIQLRNIFTSKEWDKVKPYLSWKN